MKNILDLIQQDLGIESTELFKYVQPYGWDKAKIDLKYYKEIEEYPLMLV